MLIKKGVKMNKTETVKFLEENNISFFVYKNGDILVEEKSRKLVRDFSKKLNFKVMGKDWNYNDKVGNLTFNGQKVWNAILVFNNDELIGLRAEFTCKLYERYGSSNRATLERISDGIVDRYATADFMIG
tara:strand:+ start:1159 stop:1548 length:390 start_codon:yes stop_codon:yes gene_type:complete